MFIRRFKPFGNLRRIHNPRTSIARGHGDFPSDNPLSRGWPIPLDVVEEDGHFMVYASVPGVDPKELEVTVADGILTIGGCYNVDAEHKDGKYLVRERRFGEFRRSLQLPESADAEKASPRYCNGVLSVGFPKLSGKDVKRLRVTFEEPAGELPEKSA